ncbi:hypothetical protein L0B53_15030 [Vibrio sp. SS-MA-C1-2]|uniref:hypothetical protein n=1 Tax=Vibrio sp. SS-MA-C1-2 TaxID=2908646 RepID=UPI001F391C91|nr:hypothetical protein [Vibrio sp. SS-MA-C1-2]UJF18321.1 hypothetical protein L0B53_15030 [Vibrio sp. SS-MA-C1-2]
MDTKFKEQLQNLMVEGNKLGYSFVGVVDVPGDNVCHIVNMVNVGCKAGTLNLLDLVASQECNEQKNCSTCHKKVRNLVFE